MVRLSRESDLLAACVDLADTQGDDFDVVDLMQRLVDHVVLQLDVRAAGLLLVDDQGQLGVVATSSESAAMVELYQVQVDEGPCRDAVATGEPVRVVELAAAKGRWPLFTKAALGGGFRSVHALPLRRKGETLGALNLFDGRRGPLTEDDLSVATSLADLATVSLLQQRALAAGQLIAEQLQSALTSRVAIEQAKGVLAASGGLDMDRAYAALRRHARNSNQRLSVLAQSIADGALDPEVVLGALPP